VVTVTDEIWEPRVADGARGPVLAKHRGRGLASIRAQFEDHVCRGLVVPGGGPISMVHVSLVMAIDLCQRGAALLAAQLGRRPGRGCPVRRRPQPRMRESANKPMPTGNTSRAVLSAESGRSCLAAASRRRASLRSSSAASASSTRRSRTRTRPDGVRGLGVTRLEFQGATIAANQGQAVTVLVPMRSRTRCSADS